MFNWICLIYALLWNNMLLSNANIYIYFKLKVFLKLLEYMYMYIYWQLSVNLHRKEGQLFTNHQYHNEKKRKISHISLKVRLKKILWPKKIDRSFIYMYDKVENNILIFISCFVNHSFLAMNIMHHDDKWSYLHYKMN